MQNYGERPAFLDGELQELRQRLPKVQARIGVVEDEIEEVQHALYDLDLPPSTDTAEKDLQRRDQTRAWLRQEKLRLGQREDRVRQEKANLMQLQLRLVEAKLQLQLQLQVQTHAGLSCDIESGEVDKTLQEELVDYIEYQGAVRLIPPCLILLFLTALAAWFGFDLLRNQPNLTTTQKVASIGSATFTVMTIVALLVRAAMCAGEWQWTLHACYCITGWCWLKPTSQRKQSPQQQQLSQQQQQRQQQHRPLHSNAASRVTDDPSILQPSRSEASADSCQLESASSNPLSLDGSEFEDIKKQS
ncbi:hypothetical protein WJX77_003593 [Trebouxia sp. C0004]